MFFLHKFIKNLKLGIEILKKIIYNLSVLRKRKGEKMDIQLEFDFGKTKQDVINELRDCEGEIKDIDKKLSVIEGLMRNVDGVRYEEYQRLVNELLSKKEKLQLECVEKDVEVQRMKLKEAYLKANQSQVDVLISKNKREYEEIVSQIKKNSTKAEDFKREEMIYGGKKADKHNEISSEKEKLESIESKMISLNEKKDMFAKINENYDLETVRKDIESYKTWIIENNGKIEIINKYSKLTFVNKETKAELKKEKNALTQEIKALRKEIRDCNTLKTILEKAKKVDEQIVKTDKRISKKETVIEALREEATEYRAKELYNESMYQNMLSKNKKLRAEADKIKEHIEDLSGNKNTKAPTLNENGKSQEESKETPVDNYMEPLF